MTSARASTGYLQGARVLEVADEHGEYAGKVLAGLGADVVKIEPPGGEATRGYGPFYQDQPHPERSLYFWHYNQGKRGIVLDLDADHDLATFVALAADADVIIDGRPGDQLAACGLSYEVLSAANPGLVYVRMTPFGTDGPWAGFQGSDLVHLALGGVAMNCGYDPEPSGRYETPPIAPQMWQSYQIAGEYTVTAVLAALLWRESSGQGQYLSTSVHQATATNTEMDIPHWLVLRQPHYRQTGRHSMPELTTRSLSVTKDGRYLLPYATYIKSFAGSWDADIATLRAYGMQADLDHPKWQDPDYRSANQQHIIDIVDRLVGRLTWDHELWREMQAAGQPWAPVRRPEENLTDKHWSSRGTFTEVSHPELDVSFPAVGARWVSSGPGWGGTRRAPLVGEHNEEVLAEGAAGLRPGSRRHSVAAGPATPATTQAKSPHGQPFALSGVRIVDLSWMLASAGATRILASMGAEVIKVEHTSHLDGMRHTRVVYPAGGRGERDAATTPIPPPAPTTVNQGGSFMEINAGKLGLSLNLKHPRGKQILEDLIRDADIVSEGFSPGTMERMGLGYDRLKELNPQIIYVQQSGLGEKGDYGRAKAFGPTAQAFSGITEMSGLPSPWPPAGIGYSYLDWFGAYNMATAMLSALYHRARTGAGVHIDASQVEVGLYLAGTALLDYSVNGRSWSRTGNRSPWKPAAPHGIYRAVGEDRWIAIAVFTEEQWSALLDVLGRPDWGDDARFSTLASRLAHHDDLDVFLDRETSTWDRFELMNALQARGVPAGVAQDAEDRIDHDPQLRQADWLVDLAQSENGTWPAREHPVHLSRTPTYVGGVKDRLGPNYGEDTDDVLARILGYSAEEISALRDEGAI